MKSELKTITREEAARLLQTNDKNRPIRPYVVKRYVKAMKAGEWEINGQTIVVSKTGKLIDGQHRLNAMIQAGVDLPFLLVEGVDDESFKTIDTGKVRQASDVVGIEFNCTRMQSEYLAAAAKILISLNKDGVLLDGTRPSNTAVVEFIANNEKILESLAIVEENNLLTGRVAPPSALIAIHFLASKKDQNLADFMIEKISTGANLEAGHPILTLREKCAALKSGLKALKSPKVLPMLVRCWNALRKNKSVHAFHKQEGQIKINIL